MLLIKRYNIYDTITILLLQQKKLWFQLKLKKDINL